MKNKRGFTLIELLAVIVILAVVMLIAATAVLPMMTKSRKNALLDEGAALEKAAKLAYQDPTSGAVGKKACYSLNYLHENGFYEKGVDDGYAGSVYIVPTGSGTTSTFATSFWISNNTYGYKNVTLNATKPINTTIAKATYSNAVDARDVAGNNDDEYTKCGENTADITKHTIGNV